MQIRRSISIIISAVLIVILLLLFTDPWSTVRSEGKSIVLKDPATIDRIELVDAIDSTVLVREEAEWKLYGVEPVNKVAVENLLFAAERIEINSIINEDQLMRTAMVRHIRYFRGDKIVCAYDFQVQNGNYLVSPAGSERTFAVSLSGFSRRNLDRVFSSSSNHYRDRLLIDLLPSEISLVEIDPAGGQAFRITQDKEGEIACYRSGQAEALPADTLDQLSIRLLLSYFTAIRYEEPAEISKEPGVEQVAFGRRLALLHVASHGGEQHTLQVYPYPDKAGSGDHRFLALVLYDKRPEALLVNYIFLDVLMRDLSHYFGEK